MSANDDVIEVTQVWRDEVPLTKGEAARAAGLKVFDTALPQDWLYDTVDALAVGYKRGSPIWNATYDAILSGTVWSYDTARAFGAPVGLTDEAIRLLSLLD